MELRDFLKVATGVFPEETAAFARLCQMYWEARQQGRAGLRKEDPDEQDVEVLIQNFYLSTSGVYYHPEIDELFADGTGKTGELDHKFELFWSCWPRKIAKVAARKIWIKKVKTEQHADRIIVAARAQISANNWADAKRAQFCPHATTWFNQERWNDVVGVSAEEAYRVF